MPSLHNTPFTAHWETPPNGDFARYVEELVASQARAMSGGQQMQQLAANASARHAPGKSAAKSAPQANVAANAAVNRSSAGAKVKTSAGPGPAPTVKKTTTTVHIGQPDNTGAEAAWQTFTTEAVKTLPSLGGWFTPLKIVLLFFFLIPALGLVFFGGGSFGTVGTIAVLIAVYWLSRIARQIFGQFVSSLGKSQFQKRK